MEKMGWIPKLNILWKLIFSLHLSNGSALQTAKLRSEQKMENQKWWVKKSLSQPKTYGLPWPRLPKPRRHCKVQTEKNTRSVQHVCERRKESQRDKLN